MDVTIVSHVKAITPDAARRYIPMYFVLDPFQFIEQVSPSMLVPYTSHAFIVLSYVNDSVLIWV